MVEVCAVFCYFILWYVYGTCLFYVYCSECVGVCGNVCCVATVVEESVFSIGVSLYVVWLGNVCDGCCFFCLYCDGWRSMSSVWVVWVFVMHMLYVGVLCASCDSSQCCILHDLQFVNAVRWGDHMEVAYSSAGLMTTLEVAMSISIVWDPLLYPLLRDVGNWGWNHL